MNEFLWVATYHLQKTPTKQTLTLRVASKKWKQLFSLCLQSCSYKSEHLYYQECAWTLFFCVSCYYCRDFCITEGFFYIPACLLG